MQARLWLPYDAGHGDLGYHNVWNENLIKTPALDRLAVTGIKLEGYYVQPICTPTRSQLMSGRYQIHTGLQHGVINPTRPMGLPTNIPIIANALKDLGYRTHLVGKVRLILGELSLCSHREIDPPCAV